MNGEHFEDSRINDFIVKFREAAIRYKSKNENKQ